MVFDYFQVLPLQCPRMLEAYLVEREILHRMMLRHIGQSTGNIPKNDGQCDRCMLFFAIFSVTFVQWSDHISATNEPFEASLVSFDRALNALSMTL
jgi:hypothetical protein